MADLKAIPDELRLIQPYIQRGLEVAKADPVVAYFCKYYAAQLSIPRGSAPAAQQYLTRLLDELELEKAQLHHNQSMADDSVASQHCTAFALRIFAKADTEDRGGHATKLTARNFIVASQFLQVTAAFGDLDAGVAEKIKYAKWRAAEILKAVREGRPPVPPVAKSDEEEPLLSPTEQLEQAVSPPAQREADIMGWPSPPPQQQPLEPRYSPGPQQSPPPQQPYQPQQPQQPQHPHQQPQQPQHPHSQLPGSYSSGYPSVSAPQAPPHHYTPPAPYQQQPLDSLPSVPHTKPHGSPPAHPHSQPLSSSAGAATFIPVPASSLPPVNDPADELFLDPTDAKQAQKLARWAISALDYDDVDTALDNLQKAIQILQPYRKPS